jgi:hypothetical protein
MSATLPDWIFAIGVLGALLYYTYIIRQIGEKRYKDIALQLETLNWEIDKIRLTLNALGLHIHPEMYSLSQMEEIVEKYRAKIEAELSEQGRSS